jgi:hypothetical protein
MAGSLDRRARSLVAAFAGAGFLAGALLVSDAAFAAAAKKKKSGDADDPADGICDIEEGTAGDAPGTSGQFRWWTGSVCFDISGYLKMSGRWTNAKEPLAGFPQITPILGTLNPDIKLQATSATPYGALKTTFEIDWNYLTNNGLDIIPNLDELTVSFAGFTVGYTTSLMFFWDADTYNFQFTASAPKRSSYAVSYESTFSDELKFAVGVEAGSPTSRGAISWQLPSTPRYFTARALYEKDDWAFQASAAFHQLDTQGVASLPGGPSDNRVGWAASGGITIPFKFVAEDDALTTQVTYAVNSSIFLGTAVDASFLAAQFPVTGSTRGWSAVTTYVHNWSDKWVSNVFGSYLTLDADLLMAKPSVHTLRYGVNLTYQADDNWIWGVEFDRIDAQIAFDGVVGLPDTAVRGNTVFLWVKRNF